MMRVGEKFPVPAPHGLTRNKIQDPHPAGELWEPKSRVPKSSFWGELHVPTNPNLQNKGGE